MTEIETAVNMSTTYYLGEQHTKAGDSGADSKSAKANQLDLQWDVINELSIKFKQVCLSKEKSKAVKTNLLDKSTVQCYKRAKDVI